MSTPELVLVAAVAENGIIGRDNRLPWHLPADLAHFRRLTLDRPILMGRRTWESLPGLLPRRRHIVLSGNPDYAAPGALVVGSVEEALHAAAPARELMVVGGAGLYRQTLPSAAGLHLTLVHVCVDGDTMFPIWDPDEWQETGRLSEAVIPMSAALPFMPQVVADSGVADKIKHGMPLVADDFGVCPQVSDDGVFKVVDQHDRLLAVMNESQATGSYIYCCVFSA